MGTTLVVAVVAACMIVVPVAANLGLLILATDPNPRHPPADLMGEAVGWAIAGVLVGAMVVIITESVVWPGSKGFVAKYKGLILGSAISLVIGACLGLTFAVIQMDSVDGQAITSKSLAWGDGRRDGGHPGRHRRDYCRYYRTAFCNQSLSATESLNTGYRAGLINRLQ